MACNSSPTSRRQPWPPGKKCPTLRVTHNQHRQKRASSSPGRTAGSVRSLGERARSGLRRPGLFLHEYQILRRLLVVREFREPPPDFSISGLTDGPRFVSSPRGEIAKISTLNCLSEETFWRLSSCAWFRFAVAPPWFANRGTIANAQVPCVPAQLPVARHTSALVAGLCQPRNSIATSE